jgi:hypothetical protein
VDGDSAVVGDWMGSIYDVGGRRWDFHLFLDHNGRYERTVRGEPGLEIRDSGTWEHREAENLLQLEPDAPDESNKDFRLWRVLAVKGCEDSNVLLVLRQAILASRNLPIIFYRVHCNDRAYGTGWRRNLVAPGGLPE